MKGEVLSISIPTIAVILVFYIIQFFSIHIIEKLFLLFIVIALYIYIGLTVKGNNKYQLLIYIGLSHVLLFGGILLVMIRILNIFVVIMIFLGGCHIPVAFANLEKK